MGRGIDVGVEGSFWGRGRMDRLWSCLVESEAGQAIRSKPRR